MASCLGRELLSKSPNNIQKFAHAEARRIFEIRDPDVVLGAGLDDVAVIRSDNKALLITSDYANSKRIIEQFEELDYDELGRYCVRQNLSDILGSGGAPKWFMFSIILRSDTARRNVSTLFESVERECRRFGITVVGGDTKQGSRTVVHGTLIGECEGPVWSHSNAEIDHDVYVTGPLGGVTAALCLLELSEDDGLRQSAMELLRSADVPIDLINNVISLNERCAGSDISDGLGMSIHQILKASGTGATLLHSHIPIHPLAIRASKELGIDQCSFAFGYGGDFQIVFTAPRRLDQRLREAGAFNIGSISTGESIVMSLDDNEKFPIPDFGYLDFENESVVNRFLEFSRSMSMTNR